MIRDRLEPQVKVMAVVKDNAYGHGIVKVAKHLESKTDWFCVARADEGKLLREAGVKNPILVFESPLDSTAALYRDLDLTASLTGIDSLKIMKPGTGFHINIDTGMHRLGVLPGEVHALRTEMKKYPGLNCTGIYTHFFKADDPGNPEVQKQLDIFNELRAGFPSELMTHSANTGALFHYGDLELQFDAVRPGVCLYGYSAGEDEISVLEPVMDLKSFLMQVKEVRKGETVSYGGRWVTPEDGFIGIVPAGYSDGIQRILSGRIGVEINGKKYPQVGTISMDYLIVYLGQDQPEKGADVYLLKGKVLSAGDWALKAGTIPYEITTNIKSKVIREYR